MSRPLSLHTTETIADALLELAPAARIRTSSDGAVEMHLPDASVFLRFTNVPTYGEGVQWRCDAMGPSEWHEGDVEVVEKFSLERADQLEQVVDWLADRAYAERKESDDGGSEVSRPEYVVTTVVDHWADPPVGTRLHVLAREGDEVIVGWDPNAQTPSDTRRWPMLLEHVRYPDDTQAVAASLGRAAYEHIGTPTVNHPEPGTTRIPTDPPTFDAAGNPRFKRLKLDPDLADGQNWTIHDVPDRVLLDNIRLWMEEAAPGERITIEIVEMSDEETEALPDV